MLEQGEIELIVCIPCLTYFKEELRYLAHLKKSQYCKNLTNKEYTKYALVHYMVIMNTCQQSELNVGGKHLIGSYNKLSKILFDFSDEIDITDERLRQLIFMIIAEHSECDNALQNEDYSKIIKNLEENRLNLKIYENFFEKDELQHIISEIISLKK